MPSNLPFSHKKESSESSLGGSADNSYLCMTPSPSAANGSVLTRSGSSLSSKKPERSQSFITHVQQPTPTIESSPYLDMAPATTVTAVTSNSSSPYLDMKPANNTNSDSAYLDMAPIGSSKSDTGSVGRPAASPHPIPIPQSSPYMDMAPQANSLSSSPYMDMAPCRSTENVMSSSFQGLSMTGGDNKHQYVDMTGGGSLRTSTISVQGLCRLLLLRCALCPENLVSSQPDIDYLILAVRRFV